MPEVAEVGSQLGYLDPHLSVSLPISVSIPVSLSILVPVLPVSGPRATAVLTGAFSPGRGAVIAGTAHWAVTMVNGNSYLSNIVDFGPLSTSHSQCNHHRLELLDETTPLESLEPLEDLLRRCDPLRTYSLSSDLLCFCRGLWSSLDLDRSRLRFSGDLFLCFRLLLLLLLFRL